MLGNHQNFISKYEEIKDLMTTQYARISLVKSIENS